MVDIPAAGVTPVGGPYPAALAVLEQAPPILADKIDPATGEYESILAGRDPVDAAVLVAVSIAMGTGAAVLSTGNRFRDAKFVDDKDKRVLESSARTALAKLVARGDIEILFIKVEELADFSVSGGVNDFLELTIIYLNKRASGERKRSQSIKVPLI